MVINGIDYHIETHGAGDPLVLLHGFMGSGANWQAQIEAFAAQFQVITVDLLGHGATEAPARSIRYRMEYAAQDLIAIFEQLELASVSLLGYSMGGRLALYTTLAYPDEVTRLILESASPGLKTQEERAERIQQDEALAQRIESEGVETFAKSWSNLPLFASQTPEVRKHLHKLRLQNNPQGLANSLRGMGAGAQPPLWDQLEELDLPVLLLCGELDRKFCAINREMQALILGATLEMIPDAGHTVHIEQPKRYHEVVLEFLKTL